MVSDSPDQDLDVNQRLETALRGADVAFALTVPMAVTDDPVPASVDPTPVSPFPQTPSGRLPPRQ